METKAKIVVCDIDDTVSIVGQRRRFLNEKVIDWEAFYQDDFNDEPISDTCELVKRLLSNGIRVVFSTSRREVCRERTLNWLRKHISADISDDILLMRPDDCDEPESVQKIEGVLSHYALDEIAVVLDDNDSILNAWNEKGVTTVKSAVPMGPSDSRKRELAALEDDQLEALDEFVAAGRLLVSLGVAIFFGVDDGGVSVVNTRHFLDGAFHGNGDADQLGGDDRVEDYLSAPLGIPVTLASDRGHVTAIVEDGDR